MPVNDSDVAGHIFKPTGPAAGPAWGGVGAVGRGAISPERPPTFTSWLVPGKQVLFGVFSCYRMSLRTCANP